MHQAALLERGSRKVAVAVLTRQNPSETYGHDTIRGIAKRLLSSGVAPGVLVPLPDARGLRGPRAQAPPSARVAGSRKHYYPLHELSRDRPQARLPVPQEALHLHRGARPPARVDRLVRGEGAGPPRRALGGGDLRRLGVRADGRARLPRPLLPRGVRRPGRRLLLQPGAGRGDDQVQLRRAGDGHRRPHRHGHAAGLPVRHRGAEAELPRARDQGREDLLPRDHRARRRLGRRRHQDARGARRRRVRDQRVQDLHHERPPGRLHRARHEDRPRRGLRRLHALPRGHGLARRDPREEAREARHARLRHRAARLPGRAGAGGQHARRGGQGLLPHHVGAPGRAADRRRGLRGGRPALLRPHDAVRQGARGVRPLDRPLPGDPPQVRRDGHEDRGRAAAHLHDGLALPERRVPRARDLDGQALRLARSPSRWPTSASRSTAAPAT